jgi:hypothetical protein
VRPRRLSRQPWRSVTIALSSSGSAATGTIGCASNTKRSSAIAARKRRSSRLELARDARLVLADVDLGLVAAARLASLHALRARSSAYSGATACPRLMIGDATDDRGWRVPFAVASATAVRARARGSRPAIVKRLSSCTPQQQPSGRPRCARARRLRAGRCSSALPESAIELVGATPLAAGVDDGVIAVEVDVEQRRVAPLSRALALPASARG